MPSIQIDLSELAAFGKQWTANGGALSRTPPFSSGQLGNLIDAAVGSALSAMLGGISIVTPNANSLIASEKDCVEVGPVRVVGGVRPQNFDVGYRPDGVRFAFDSKTLNDKKSIGKNWQNMVNDLATEATTVHSRFPYAVVAFIVVLPKPALGDGLAAILGTLERLGGRRLVDEPEHRAEAMALVVWDPATGQIDPSTPEPSSPLRIERFSDAVQENYKARYKGLPPHTD